MILLILTILLGIVFSVFATQNTTAVPIHVADLTYTFPLYIILAAGLVLGLFIGLLYNLLEKVGSYSSLRSKKATIKKLQSQNKKLRKKVAILESKKEEIKDDLGEKKQELRQQKVENIKEDTQDFFGKIKESLSF